MEVQETSTLTQGRANAHLKVKLPARPNELQIRRNESISNKGLENRINLVLKAHGIYLNL
jgi:hypothetical protein